MSLYRFVRDNGSSSGFEPVAATRLLDAGILERRDLQRALADNLSPIEPGLFVVAKEFTDWADSKRRVDLLCIDREANLVVVELKREDVSASMDLQAVRFAAIVLEPDVGTALLDACPLPQRPWAAGAGGRCAAQLPAAGR